jgi:hypothetical protein
MKHKRLKTYLLNGILLFGIILFTHSCQKDENVASETLGGIKIERISLYDFNNSVSHSDIYNRIDSFFDINSNSSSDKFSKIDENSEFTILTDEIIAIYDNDYTSYTFTVDMETENETFYNLVLKVDNQSEIISSKFFEYQPSSDWLLDTNQHFTGILDIVNNDFFDTSGLVYSKNSSPCVGSVVSRWVCNKGNNHSPIDALDNPDLTCTSWTTQTTIEYVPCSGGSGTPPNGNGDGVPVDGGTYTGGGGTSNNDNTNNDNEPNLNEDTVINPPRDTKDKDEVDCTYANLLLSFDSVKNLIQNLNTDDNLSLNYEKGHQINTADNGDLSAPNINGNPNSTSIQVSVNEQGTVTGFIHTHYDGLVPNFSIEDIRTLDAIFHQRVANNKPITDVIMILVSRGGVYATVISDPNKLLANGGALHTNAFKRIKERYDRLFKKDQTAEKVERLMIDRRKTLSKYGLSLLKAKSDLSGWQVVKPNPNNSNKTKYEDCN